MQNYLDVGDKNTIRALLKDRGLTDLSKPEACQKLFACDLGELDGDDIAHYQSIVDGKNVKKRARKVAMGRVAAITKRLQWQMDTAEAQWGYLDEPALRSMLNAADGILDVTHLCRNDLLLSLGKQILVKNVAKWRSPPEARTTPPSSPVSPSVFLAAHHDMEIYRDPSPPQKKHKPSSVLDRTTEMEVAQQKALVSSPSTLMRSPLPPTTNFLLETPVAKSTPDPPRLTRTSGVDVAQR